MKEFLDKLCRQYERGIVNAYHFKMRLVEFLITPGPDQVDFNSASSMADTIFANFENDPSFDTGNPLVVGH